MTPGNLAFLIGLVLLPPLASPARALDAGAIMAGSPGTTATRVAQDIADLVGHFGVALEVVSSQGGPGNVEALIRRPDTQLGIVQSDTLDFLASFSNDPELRHRVERMQMVGPLHPEEVHVLARPGIATFGDLQGKRVAVGNPDSDTLVTATLLLSLAGIAPAEEVRLGDAGALAALRAGRIDAMIYVAGQPAPLLRDNVAIEDALHLVPVDDPRLQHLYPSSVIPADTYYPWQPKAVPTLAPRAVLVTLRWRLQTDHEQEECRLVGKVARIIADNLDRLRRIGHPKWREIDLETGAPFGWEQSPCVAQALGGPESFVLDAPEEASPSAPSASPDAWVAGQPPARAENATTPRTCSEEDAAIRRRLCEARRQVGTEHRGPQGRAEQ